MARNGNTVAIKTANGWVTGIVYVKIGENTWKQALHIYVKTANGWKGY